MGAQGRQMGCVSLAFLSDPGGFCEPEGRLHAFLFTISGPGSFVCLSTC